MQTHDHIVQVGDGVLRKVAEPIPVADIPSKKIQDIIRTMQEVLDQEPDGAALAAPQIGISLRLFVLSRRVFQAGEVQAANGQSARFVYINPKIIKRSRKKDHMDEGCLSVRGKYGTIKRSTNVTIEAYDEFGNKFTRGAGGLLAQAFQHETDHLEGTLFIDTVEDLWDVPPSRRT
jgi:peptide deformylase